MNIFSLLISTFLLTYSGSEAHPIHASICEIKYNEDVGAFQVSLKIFIDDFNVAVMREGMPSLNLGAPKENPDTEYTMATYLDKYFTITLDGKKIPITFVGKEVSDDYLAVWCYLEYPVKVSKGQKCTITNRVLLDLYSDQRNIMDIKMSKTQETHTIFDPSNSSWSFTF